MKPHYNQNYTREEIVSILQTIKDCIRESHFSIAQNKNRQENFDFIKDYNLNSRKQKEILLQIELGDFCHSLKNTKVGYEHEILYVFCTRVRLYNFEDNEEMVDIYTKFNIIDTNGGKHVVIISFHKRNKPIRYCFR